MLFHRGNIFTVVRVYILTIRERDCAYIYICYSCDNVSLGVQEGFRFLFRKQSRTYNRGLCNARNEALMNTCKLPLFADFDNSNR